MEPIQTNMQPSMAASKGKLWMWVVIAVVVVAIAVLAWWWYAPQSTPSVPSAGAPAAPLTSGDTTTDINKDLGTVDLGNPGQDVNTLDADINQL